MMVMNISNLNISGDMLYKFSTLFFRNGSHSGELMHRFTVTAYCSLAAQFVRKLHSSKKFQDSVN